VPAPAGVAGTAAVREVAGGGAFHGPISDDYIFLMQPGIVFSVPSGDGRATHPIFSERQFFSGFFLKTCPPRAIFPD
jgi:hypothetical protein